VFITEFVCNQALMPGGCPAAGQFHFSNAAWERFEFSHATGLHEGPYMVPVYPMDFHCHGVGKFDFSDIRTIDFSEINDILEGQGIEAVITLHLKRADLDTFLDLCRNFYTAKRLGFLTRISGIALEGPMLASPGGAPCDAIWAPTVAEWKALANCGQYGLKYIVLSPDAGEFSRDFVGAAGFAPSTDWIIEKLIDGNVLPAFGHFRRDEPSVSAMTVLRSLQIAERRGVKFLSDHLFNDMPRLFKHAWRSTDERSRRGRELEVMAPWTWAVSDAEKILGPVPSALLRGAQDGLLWLALNFDGEHVDLAISSQMIALVGSSALVGMTDRIEGRSLGGHCLSDRSDNSLLYRGDGTVAAGTQSIKRQFDNLRRFSVSDSVIWQMFGFNPAAVIMGRVNESGNMAPPAKGTFVDASGSFHNFSVQTANDRFKVPCPNPA
jgi:N-acetylglucosamine-6-phosphate deacetylase